VENEVFLSLVEQSNALVIEQEEKR